MKKQLFIVLALHQVVAAASVAEVIGKTQKSTSEMIIVKVGDGKTKVDFPELLKQVSDRNATVVILGDISGHEWNRMAFNQRQTLVDVILQQAGLLNDPAFAEMREYAMLISSPYVEQTILALGQKEAMEESNPGDYQKVMTQMAHFLENSFEPNQKVAAFVKQNVTVSKFNTRLIDVAKDFLSRPVAVGVLNLKDATKTGISMKAVMPWTLTTAKLPVDFLIAVNEKSIELVYQPWAITAVEVIKETFIKKGYAFQSATRETKQSGLIFSFPSAGAPSTESLYAVITEAFKVAAKAVPILNRELVS